MDNIVKASFGARRETRTRPLYQYDYGCYLQFVGLDLPAAYEVHFSNSELGESKTQIGNADGVLIPAEYLKSGESVYAWIFLHVAENDGETRYTAVIPVKRRAKPTDIEPTPEEESTLSQLVTALNNGVNRAEQAASNASSSAIYAQDEAVNANSYADRAYNQAEQAKQFAGIAAAQMQQAAIKADQAAASAIAAGGSASLAKESEEAAAESAEAAEASAERAEQAAKDAGYIYFYIDENGDLIAQRTSNTQVDFYLNDGDLYVRAEG